MNSQISMPGRSSSLFGVVIGTALLALWVAPLVRAKSFFEWALNYHNETGSVDAANQMSYASALLLSYLVSSGGCLVIAALFVRKAALLHLISIGLAAYASGMVLHAQPEHAFHLFPSFKAWQPAQLTFAAVIASGTITLLLNSQSREGHSPTKVIRPNRA